MNIKLLPFLSQTKQAVTNVDIKAFIRDAEVYFVTRQEVKKNQKNKKLQRELHTTKTLVKNQQERLTQLSHKLKDTKQQLERTYDGSLILQQVEPTYLSSNNPIHAIHNFLTYQKEKRIYKKFVATQGGLETFESFQEYMPESIQIYDRMLHVDDTYIHMYYLAGLPRNIRPSMMFQMMTSSLPFHFSLFFRPLAKSKVISNTQKRVTALSTLQEFRERRGLVRDKQLDEAIEENEQIAENLITEKESMFDVAMYIQVEASSKEALAEFDKELRMLAETNQIVLNTYTFGQKDAFKSMLPFGRDIIRERRALDTTALATMLPFTVRDMYDPTGVFIGSNAYHNSIVTINPFTQLNSNMSIFGVSGSGKSTTAKVLINRLYLRGTKIIILDVKGEYRNLVKELGGQVVQFSVHTGINPFALYSTEEHRKEDIIKHIDVLKSFFKFFIQEKNYNPTLLDKALTQIYNDVSKKPTFSNFIHLLKNTPMYDDLDVVHSGSLKGMFSSSEELSLKKDIVVFDISQLRETKLEKPAMYLLTSHIWQLIDRLPDERKMLFIDEAHNLLKDIDIASFYQKIVKEGRSRLLGTVSITQDVDDFLRSDFGHAIVTNSATTMLLRQSYATIPYIDRIAGMSDTQKQNLTTLQNGEVVIVNQEGLMNAFVEVLPSERHSVFTVAPEYGKRI